MSFTIVKEQNDSIWYDLGHLGLVGGPDVNLNLRYKVEYVPRTPRYKYA